MTCDLCKRPEPREFLCTVYLGEDQLSAAEACRRCRLSPDHRALWDAMAVAEMAVINDPEDSSAFGELLRARVAFDTAVRPHARRRGRGTR